MNLLRIAITCVLCASAIWPSTGVGQTVGTKAESVAVGTARQQQWLAATPNERVRLAEALGEDGARAMAKAKNYELLFDGLGRTLQQGPDQVYRAPDGRVIVYEAKGGSGQLGRAYGHAQGSTEWAVESARRVLRSSKASQVEQAAAREILQAAAKGTLEVHVIRTSHVLGEPTAAVLEGVAKTTDDAARLAQSALDDLARVTSEVVDDVARSTDDVVRAAGEGGSRLRAISKTAIPVAVAVDAGFRVRDGIETERRFAAGEITVQQREKAHAKNAAGMAGGWGGAAGGAWVAGEVAAPIAAWTGPAAPYIEGAAIVAGGMVGYIYGEEGAEQAAEWTVGKIHDAGATVAETTSQAWQWSATQTRGGWNRVFGN